MSRLKIPWTHLIALLLGSLICYLTLQYSYFNIKTELDVPGILLSTIGLFIGLYIANTIQRRINKNQNQHNYIESKLDSIWTRFTDLSKTFIYNHHVDLSTIAGLNHDILHPLDNLKTIFESFELKTSSINDLTIELEEFEGYVTNLPIENNLISLSLDRQEIDKRIVSVNKIFSRILKEIQNL